MERHSFTTDELVMMFSNVFLVIPMVYAGLYGEQFFFYFALGILLCSPLFHWYKIMAPESRPFWVFRIADWIFAVGCFGYMYWYVSDSIGGVPGTVLHVCLAAVIIFFWYGWRYGNYAKLHPWFHAAAGLLSFVILAIAHP